MKSLFLLVLLVSWACGEQRLASNGEVRSAANVVKSVGNYTNKIMYHAGRVAKVTTLDKLLKHVIEVHGNVRQVRAKFTQEVDKVSDKQSLLDINSEFQQWGLETKTGLVYLGDGEILGDHNLNIKVNLSKAKDAKGVKLALQRVKEINDMLTKPLITEDKRVSSVKQQAAQITSVVGDSLLDETTSVAALLATGAL